MSETTEGVRISRRLAVVNSVASQLTFVLKLTVLLWINQHLAKRVPPEEFALLPVVNGLMLLPPVFTDIMTSGHGRFVMRAMGRNDTERVKEIVSSLVPRLMLAAIAFTAIGGVAVWGIEALVDVDARFLADCRLMLAMLLFTFVVRLPVAPFLTGFYVKQEVVRDRSIKIAGELLRLVVVILLTLLLDARVIWLIVGSTLSSLAVLAVRFRVSRRLLPELRFSRAHVGSDAWRDIMSFGWWFVLRKASRRIRDAITPIITLNLAGAAEASALHLGTMIQRQGPTAVGTALSPIGPPMIAMFARGEVDRARAAFLNGTRYAFIMTGFLIMPFLVFYQPFIDIYLRGSVLDLGTVGLVMLIATATVLLRTSSTLVGALANAAGEMSGLAWRAVVTQFAALIATVVCVGPLGQGAIGAVAGPLVVLLLLLPLLHLRFSLRLARTTAAEWAARAIRPVLRPCIVALALWAGARIAIAPQTWFQLAAAWAPGGVAFAVLAWTDGLRPGERRDILRALEKLAEKLLPSWVGRRARKLVEGPSVPVARRVEALLHTRSRKGREDMSLPHFLVIGAQKSGTTWLHAALSAHPDVYMPERKELHYFDLELHRPLHLYTREFEKAPRSAIRGEITPAYAILSPARVGLVRSVMPDARLVFIMRDPVERAWSQTVMELATRRGQSIESASESEIRAFLDSPACRLRGDYAMTIERWERRFPREQILYSFFKDVGERRLLEDVFRHVGVSTEIDWNAMPLGEIIRPRVGPATEDDHTEAPPWVRALLAERYGDMIDRLEQRFGAPVGRWRR